jgi:hypothetical protein
VPKRSACSGRSACIGSLDRAVRFDPRDPAHRGWDAKPEGPTSMDRSSDRAAAQPSLRALVQSEIVPDECNLPMNPAHPDAGVVRAG